MNNIIRFIRKFLKRGGLNHTLLKPSFQDNIHARRTWHLLLENTSSSTSWTIDLHPQSVHTPIRGLQIQIGVAPTLAADAYMLKDKQLLNSALTT